MAHVVLQPWPLLRASGVCDCPQAETTQRSNGRKPEVSEMTGGWEHFDQKECSVPNIEKENGSHDFFGRVGGGEVSRSQEDNSGNE